MFGFSFSMKSVFFATLPFSLAVVYGGEDFFFGLLFVSCWWSIHNCFYGLLFNALFYSFHLVDFVAHPGFTMMFTYILDNVGWVLVNGPSTVIRHVDSDTPQIPQARIHIFSRKFLFI